MLNIFKIKSDKSRNVLKKITHLDKLENEHLKMYVPLTLCR